jgi:hypothetical protein
MENVKITGTGSCPGCQEAVSFIKHRLEKKENITLVLVFIRGKIHYHAPISTVQFEKMNREFNLLT